MMTELINTETFEGLVGELKKRWVKRIIGEESPNYHFVGKGEWIARSLNKNAWVYEVSDVIFDSFKVRAVIVHRIGGNITPYDDGLILPGETVYLYTGPKISCSQKFEFNLPSLR